MFTLYPFQEDIRQPEAGWESAPSCFGVEGGEKKIALSNAAAVNL